MEKIPRSVFTQEFKEEAVKMVIDGGLSQPEVCRRLSLGHSTLARWVRQARSGILLATKRSPVTEEGMEISRLRAENAELKEDHGIPLLRILTDRGSECSVVPAFPSRHLFV